MKWRIEDIPVFHAVVATGGMTGASRSLGMPKSSVSKSVARLEQDLRIRLFDRNSRRVRVTREGELFFQQCQKILDQVSEADAVMTGLVGVPNGRLSVALPPAFCEEILAPRLAEFHHRYPRIELDVEATTRAIDMLADRFDIAVVVGVQESSELAQKVLIGGRLIWVTSPAYLAAHEIGDGVRALERHLMICERRYGDRTLMIKQHGHLVRFDVGPHVARINNPLAVRRAVAHGAGVSFLPEHYCVELLEEGRLVEIGKEVVFDTRAAQLTAIFPSRKLISSRARAFLDFLEEICAEPRTR
ncbi:LysR family transcriptional regulator [Bradyrhizobium oligotrophicum S58]|uniref:LysR family transcriptional regulator n=1 Tax=Bradyrhizobium oligotrophicum S58 TaxID=1245469 RepID=M4ZDV9_9BRAD|nr:LysR family transcriptional regulator [Bradyrhizobium oligotrophicum]BAM91676.1 LysR family transcriptional regulator [Bradyrhizobium oligotrophicum S58]